MYDSATETLAAIRELPVPPVFVDIWTKDEPRRFCQHWHRPVGFFEAKDDLERLCPRLKGCIAILESGRHRVIGLEPCTGSYFEYFFGAECLNVIGITYQQFLTSIFVDLGFADLVDLVEEVSGLFEYEHLDEFLTFMDEDDDGSAEAAKSEFVRSIQGLSE